MKEKILFYCTLPSKERGFTGANIGNLVTYNLLKDHFEVIVINTGSNHFNPYENNLKHFVYNIKIFFHYISVYNLLYKTVRQSEFKYFYFLPATSTAGHFRDLLTIWIVRSKVKKIIGHNRNGNFPDIYKRKWHRFFTKKFINDVDVFIFLSEELKKISLYFLPDHKAAVAFNPIDTAITCTEEEIKKKIEERSTQKFFNILFLSNMIPSKGYMDVAKAAISLKEKFSYFKIFFIGRWNSAKDEQKMKEFISRNNLSEYIEVHGKITDRATIKDFLLQSDLFVLPTYYPVEAQPRSIIEAMNAAIPVISTFHASIPEMLQNNKEGMLIQKQSPEEIVTAVLKMKDREVWKTFAINCRINYEKKFSEAAVKQQLLKVFV